MIYVANCEVNDPALPYVSPLCFTIFFITPERVAPRQITCKYAYKGKIITLGDTSKVFIGEQTAESFVIISGDLSITLRNTEVRATANESNKFP